MLQRKHSNVSDKPKPSHKPKRSASFGRFDALRFSSPARLEEFRTDRRLDGHSVPKGEQDKASTLGKKMRAISMTVRKRMGKSYIKALSEETVEDTGQGHEGQAEGNVQCLRRGNNSLETLYSLSCNSSSSSGVGSRSKNRHSLWLDVELPYTGPFCGRARVHTDFVPSPYDTDSLRLKVGDVIDVISKTPVGIWTGILHDKVGTFKFIYVDLLEEVRRENVRPYRRRKLPMLATLQEFLEKLHLEEHASTLLLNGYQTVEDLRELTEQHLCELNMTDPEQRRLLLATAHSLSDAEDAEDEGAGDPEKGAGAGSPRDSGCYVAPGCSEKAADTTPTAPPCQDAVVVQT
uniref:SAM domain, SH3 domain and nuclear localisation signals 1b n=1 Tax=Paramormyrops kingsleyae TaxID=1676925 RepID=A0A3B3RTN8_9TELE|nr:SAM domain-containing protein SAMSN-1-like isoform X1 [Paramormyrops kingsleyae]